MKKTNYKLYQSPFIEKNQQTIVGICKNANLILKQKSIKDSTWDFEKYNLFSITSSSYLFFKIYKELNYYIRDYVNDKNKPLWITSWLNYHEGNEVEKKLPPHTHPFDYHGYISIQPQDTTTIFHKGYEINNKIGQIYIGQGNGQENIRPELTHYVKINTPYEGLRVTIGFDISTKLDVNFSNSHFYPLI
tara:strand:- start:54 stop:623 length:570 start_codon:yes stop_codon:yes gene_type:complete